MRNLIVILACISSLGYSGYAQSPYFKEKDTLRFAPDSSYSRAIQRVGKNELLFATSKTGVVRLHEPTGKCTPVFGPSSNGEFRDVWSNGKQTCAIVSGNNGELWEEQNHAAFLLWDRPGAFFDAMDVRKDRIILLGDPIDHRFMLFFTDLSTGALQVIHGPEAIGDEACYAASGTTITWLSDSAFAFISGGSSAVRFHQTHDLGKTWQSQELPMVKGEGCGPFSLHFINDRRAMIVGGCYQHPKDATQSSLYSIDGGNSWKVSATPAGGYRSCVTGNAKVQFACGTNGIDISTDGGNNWQPFDTGNYCALLLEKKTLYATTNKGTCIKYRLK